MSRENCALDALRPALVATAAALLERARLDPTEAEDLVQDALLRYLQRGIPPPAQPQLLRYLAMIMRRLVIDRMRRQGQDPLDCGPLPIEAADWMLPLD